MPTPLRTRGSVLGVMAETTEGTPVVPASATDYIPLQSDFKITPETDVKENAETRASIGASKPILGAEAPKASGSFYVKHSGVEGQVSQRGKFLKAIFGAQSVAVSEQVTAASSTTTVIKSTGASTNFQRGDGLLIKDPVNGYNIRAVHSVSSNDIVPSFALPAAPGTGVALGKSILWKPADSGHDTLTLSFYVSNGGALQRVAGARVTEYTATAESGELINSNFSFEALSYYFDPIVISSADRYLDFTDDDGTFAAIVAVGTYKNPHQLAQAVEDAMNATASTQTYTVSWMGDDATYAGKFRIVGTGTLLSLLWNTGTNTANTIGDKMGFSTAADDTGNAATAGYASDSQLSWAAPHTPTYDDSDPLAAKYHEVMMGDQADYACFGASKAEWKITDTRKVVGDLCAESGQSGSLVTERLATVSITALLSKHNADFMNRYQTGDELRFQYNYGLKSTGNWIAGKCGGFYMPTATITSIDVDDDDGLAILNIELTGFVNESSEGEAYEFNV